MKRLVLVLGVLGALAGSPAADASVPVPWCGTDVVARDRLPDATPGFAVHVIYAHPPGSPDRFLEWAPRIAGDVTAIDAWWRAQDPTRAPRFDLFAFPCESVFGAVDISRVTLPADIESIGVAFGNLRGMIAADFHASEKVYLVYYDGPTNQRGLAPVCGQGAAPFRSLPGVAIVFLDSCDAEETDALRPVVAVHELVHVLGAVVSQAPNECESGHVCDDETDLMAATLSGNELEAHVLDVGRDDYYAHSGPFLDLRKSFYLERLDSPDRLPPSSPAALNATGPTTGGGARFSWSASADDVGPASYRITRDGRLIKTVRTTSTTIENVGTRLTQLSVRAVDAVGHLSPPAELYFKGGLGVVDARGRLLRDTVRPGTIDRVAVVRVSSRAVVLSWRPVRDAGGLRGYRVTTGPRMVTVQRPAITLDPTRLRVPVRVAAIDRAGNVGAQRSIPLSRLR